MERMVSLEHRNSLDDFNNTGSFLGNFDINSHPHR